MLLKRGLIFIGALAVALSAVMADRWEGEGETNAVTAGTSDTTVSETEVPPTQPAESLDRQELPLPEALTAVLNDEKTPPDEVEERAKAFAAAHDVQQEPATVVREDLDADGVANEWVYVMFQDIKLAGTEESIRRAAYGGVIAYVGGNYELQGFEFPDESYGRAKLATIAELTGDGRPDLVWASFQVGAHTSLASYTVSSWADGALSAIDGTAEMPNASDIVAKDGRLSLFGGMIGSAGAGPWQREFTDEYVVADGALAHVDRTFAASPTSYHRLIDALWAEALGQTERAKRLLAEAIELDDATYAGYAFDAKDGVVEGGADPELEASFEAAVEQFARFRLALLARVESGEIREDACAGAREAPGYDASLLPSLNSPFGYMNPQWNEQSLCAGIDELEL